MVVDDRVASVSDDDSAQGIHPEVDERLGDFAQTGQRNFACLPSPSAIHFHCSEYTCSAPA